MGKFLRSLYVGKMTEYLFWAAIDANRGDKSGAGLFSRRCPRMTWQRTADLDTIHVSYPAISCDLARFPAKPLRLLTPGLNRLDINSIVFLPHCAVFQIGFFHVIARRRHSLQTIPFPINLPCSFSVPSHPLDQQATSDHLATITDSKNYGIRCLHSATSLS